MNNKHYRSSSRSRIARTVAGLAVAFTIAGGIGAAFVSAADDAKPAPEAAVAA